ncbi:hypothetical protein MelnitzEXVC044M_163 [Methylophilales phage Melnitz EXVC044M]|nr:hypothetical protein Melnitz1EXVC043M_162 [Methylophilales phage Melnitz-1 EXVC043M]QZI94667.1 hypothetical protein Melnitz2EXVC040M_163 [Methylophilales phage Melnitz-2 EXVC040M]QZI94889.1 hypothetical protein MelnitzEXVC044M_163 [Methylophilales phage Melnitz EXVC044M]QZI95110.1 hypothetical protein Melnitz3EXVC039M_163 [Methylophilales phage Melnitz-3 EXVC039M]
MAIDKITASGLGDGGVSTADIADGAITTAKIANNAVTDAKATITVTPAAVSDTANTSTGGFTMPSGTTAQRPGSPDTGESRMNTTTGSLEFYDGSGWVSTNLIPNISSITGDINNAYATNLVFAVTNNTDTVDIVFLEGGVVFHTVTGQAVSSGGFTLATPSQVYGQTAGDTISIQIKNVDGTPSGNSITKTVVAAPTGGTITTSGNYRIHSFTSSGNFINTNTLSLDYLIVAGGAGGGGGANATWHGGGGGGAGGLIYLTGQSRTAGTHSVVVGTGGSGGAGGSSTSNHGGNGNNSTFNGSTATGGGGGGPGLPGTSVANSGGSGGGNGGGNSTPNYSSGTSGQGNRGGSSLSTSGPGGDPYGAGGGGAGGVGGNDGQHIAGPGGAGLNNSITGSAVGYAGGGGGGNATDGSDYAGNAGGTSGVATHGGGAGGGAYPNNTSVSGSRSVGSNGTNGTGGGGGGGSGGTPQYNGGSGGSGIVIIRYDMTA